MATLSSLIAEEPSDLDFFHYWGPLNDQEIRALQEGDVVYLQNSSGKLLRGAFCGIKFYSNTGAPRYYVLVGEPSRGCDVAKQGRIVSASELGNSIDRRFPQLTEEEYLALRPGDAVVCWGPPILGGWPSMRHRGVFMRFETEEEGRRNCYNCSQAYLEEKKRVPAAVINWSENREIFISRRFVLNYQCVPRDFEHTVVRADGKDIVAVTMESRGGAQG